MEKKCIYWACLLLQNYNIIYANLTIFKDLSLKYIHPVVKDKTRSMLITYNKLLYK